MGVLSGIVQSAALALGIESASLENTDYLDSVRDNVVIVLASDNPPEKPKQIPLMKFIIREENWRCDSESKNQDVTKDCLGNEQKVDRSEGIDLSDWEFIHNMNRKFGSSISE